MVALVLPSQYRVLRSFVGDENRTYEPGDIITVDADWPFHRANDLVKQRYLESLAPSSAPERKGNTRG